MRFTVDTSVLVRAVVQDDVKQGRAAAKLLKQAQGIAVAMPVLCEFVWVLRRVYAFDAADVAAAIRALLAATNVLVDRPAAEAGLAMLDLNGDFADGAIAYEGSWLGGRCFVSFDKQAVAMLVQQGLPAQLL